MSPKQYEQFQNILDKYGFFNISNLTKFLEFFVGLCKKYDLENIYVLEEFIELHVNNNLTNSNFEDKIESDIPKELRTMEFIRYGDGKGDSEVSDIEYSNYSQEDNNGNVNNDIDFDSDLNNIQIQDIDSRFSINENDNNKVYNDSIYIKKVEQKFIGKNIDFLKNYFEDIKTDPVENIDIDKNISITNNVVKNKQFDNILNKYFNYEKHYYPSCRNNININKNYENINNSIKQKDIENANIVYNLGIIYDKYLHDNKEKLDFDDFIEFNKNNYELIEISNTRMKNRYKRCYMILENILQLDKNKIINILSRLKLTYSKIYKLHDTHRSKLNDFIYNEINKKIYKNIDNHKMKNTNTIDIEMVNTLLKEIPFNYIGNKKSVIEQVIKYIY